MQRKIDLLFFNIVIIQQLDKFCFINNFKYIDLNIVLFKAISKKQKFNLFDNHTKIFYNKVITKYIYYKKLFYKVVNY